MTQPALPARLVALFDHLGIVRAHVASQIPADLAGLAASCPERLGGIVLCTPVRLDAEPFAAVADRILLIAGEYGPSFETVTRAAQRLPGAARLVLDGYEVLGWSDVVAERAGEVSGAMLSLFGRVAAEGATIPAGAGEHAGITYRVEGSGPPLVLLPFFLAPSQWDAALPVLAQHFTVIRLGGRHLGGVAMLEDRAAAPTYRAMFRTIADLLALSPGASVLDVGCGAGSLDRLLAAWLGPDVAITACDANPFLLGEATVLAADEGARIRFVPGNAEALPFPDDSFDAAFSVTVLEECDADRAIGEMVRVVRPGGRVAVVVRAIDLPQWWGLGLPEAIRRKVTAPPRSVARGGVADASLYRRVGRAGLLDVTGFPFVITLDRPDGPIWRYREDHALSLLTGDERQQWEAAKQDAAAAGPVLASHSLHCAVGRKPG